MSQFMRYTCQAGLLSVVKAALIANGYTLDGSPRAEGSAATAVVLQCGTTAVLLAQPPNNAVAEIEVWGAGQSATADVFDSLPIELHKQPPLRSALRSPERDHRSAGPEGKRMYQITYRADRWQAVQHRNPTAGAWQIAHQDLPDHQRLSVELHRTSDGSVSITDARIEYAFIGRTGKPHWHTRRTLHPDEVLLEEVRFDTE